MATGTRQLAGLFARKRGAIVSGNARRKRRILHTSDWHLEVLNDPGCRSLEMLLELVIGNNVDLVLIAGDFFDSNRVKDDVVSFAVKQLRRLPVSTVILPGNHDCLVADSVYHRGYLWNGAPNIKIIKALEGETLVFPDLGITVWGKPIPTYGDDIHPLSGIPRPEGNEHWHIGIAHGYFMGPQSRPWASFHITTEDIVASRQDYIALGDAHAFSCVCAGPVTAYYCGAPSSASQTVAIIDLAEGTGAQVSKRLLEYRRHLPDC